MCVGQESGGEVLQFSSWTFVQMPSQPFFLDFQLLPHNIHSMHYVFSACASAIKKHLHTLNQLTHFIYDVLALGPMDKIHEIHVKFSC